MDTFSKFFNPQKVVLIGASRKRGKIGYEILKNLLKSGKKIYAVNPHGGEVMGLKFNKSLEEIEDNVDLAVIAIDAEKCPAIVEKCGEKGIKNVVIISGGFGEVGRKELEGALIDISKKYGIRIIGPNCIGVFNGKNGFNTFFQRNMELPPHGNVAILTQSGTFGIALLEKLAKEGIGVSKFISYGNKVDVDEIELIEYLNEDGETELIGMYVEEVKRKFFDITIDKPIIILKAGRSRLGKRAASLHTGALATNYEIFKGACRQRRMIFAEDFEEFFDLIRLMSNAPVLKEGKMDIITNGAGPAVLACDFIEDAKNLELGEIVDLTGSASGDDFIKAVHRSKAGIILLVLVFQDSPLAESVEELYKGLEKENRMLIVVSIGGKFVEEQRKRLSKIGIPVFEESRRVVQALDKVLWYYGRK